MSLASQTPLSARIVRASCSSAWLVIVICAMLGTVATAYAVRHFAMTTDSLELISPDIPWRRDKAAFDQAFPQQSDVIAVVVDGATPELADSGAASLAERLSHDPQLFRSVRRPEGGPFFERNGILFLPLPEVEATTRQLIAAQPFLGTLAADPSLRGVMQSLSIALEGVRQHQADLDQLLVPMRAIADALDHLVRGTPAFFSWRTLIAGKPPTARDTRQLVLVHPVLDHGILAPGGPASDAIRAAARDLGLDAAHGVRVRLTGSVVLADEEFSTLKEHAVPMTAGTIAAVLLMIWLAVRSARMTAAIVATAFTGLVLATGLGLFIVGRFNLISIAFIPVFVGLGIDFAIQFTVRCRAERLSYPNLRSALIAAGATVGRSLALSAGAIAAGFFAFLPTDYQGASELGIIAGVGIIIAFLLSVTLLPALLTVMRSGGRRAAVALAALAPLEHRLLRNRTAVLAVGGLAAAVSLALLPFLRFDFNPLHLRNPKAESVSTLLDLMSDPERTPNTIDVLAPSLEAADKLAERLSLLPEVAAAVTLSNFIPSQQTEKLALVGDAATLLDLTLNPLDVELPPSDAQTVQALATTAAALRRAAAGSATPSADEALRLAGLLDTLAQPAANRLRGAASDMLVAPFKVVLDQLRAMLHASRITLQDLPADLTRDWEASDHRMRIQVFPRGDSNDNRTLRQFSAAVRQVAPDATGAPISIQEAARTIVGAFIEAGISSFLAITVLLVLAFRRARDVILTLIPILLTGLLTLATCVLANEPLNFANIIALPLLFGVGVAFNIYYIVAWRSGATNLLTSALTRAVICSALTTAAAFAGLCFSSHPGTRGIGVLLLVSLGWTLVVALLLQPPLLARVGSR